MTNSLSNISQTLFGTVIRILLPVLILAAGGAAYYTLSQGEEEAKRPEPKERIIRTRVAELSVQDYPVSIVTQGTVQSHNEIALSGQVSGQIVKLSPHIEVGAYFTEGEILIELDDRDYAARLKATEAALLSAQSTLNLADSEHERTLGGFAGTSLSVITEAAVDRSAATLTRAQADVDGAVVAVEQAILDLERTKIRAPFDGRVRQKLVGLGQSLNPGTPSAVIFAIDFAEVRLPISTRDQEFLTLPEVDGAASIPVELRDAINLESDTTWKANIVRTEGTLDEGSLELFAVARIDDPFGFRTGRPPLRIGQPVSGTIRGEILSDVVVIPRGAVRELDQIILISKSDNTLNKTTIQPIWSDEEFVVVRNSSRFEGMLLATTHIVYAPDGATVEIIPNLEDTDASSDDT